MSLRTKILFHDNCFDGTASAALFTRFYRQTVRADAEKTQVKLRDEEKFKPFIVKN